MAGTNSHHLMGYSSGPPVKYQTSPYIDGLRKQAARHMQAYLAASNNGHPPALDTETGIPADLLNYTLLQNLIMDARKNLPDGISTRPNMPLESVALLQQ